MTHHLGDERCTLLHDDVCYPGAFGSAFAGTTGSRTLFVRLVAPAEVVESGSGFRWVGSEELGTGPQRCLDLYFEGGAVGGFRYSVALAAFQIHVQVDGDAAEAKCHLPGFAEAERVVVGFAAVVYVELWRSSKLLPSPRSVACSEMFRVTVKLDVNAPSLTVTVDSVLPASVPVASSTVSSSVNLGPFSPNQW